MNEKHEKFLPLGSVVLLKDAKKRLMITGFCTMDNEDKTTLYDYSGCLYPEGVISSDETALFNHDQIEKIFSLGYSDEEDIEFKKKLNELLQANELIKDTAPASVLNKEPELVTQQPAVQESPVVEHERLTTEEPVIKPLLEPIFAEKQPEQNQDKAEEVPAVGPGLPGYVAPTPEAEAVPAVGPGLPGYVAPSPEAEAVPAVGPGLPGYVAPPTE